MNEKFYYNIDKEGNLKGTKILEILKTEVESRNRYFDSISKYIKDSEKLLQTSGLSTFFIDYDWCALKWDSQKKRLLCNIQLESKPLISWDINTRIRANKSLEDFLSRCIGIMWEKKE